MTSFSVARRSSALAAGLLLLCLFGGCATESQPAGLPEPAQTSTTAAPASHARIDALCQQPGGTRSKLCESSRYSSFGSGR